ncbi:hypothetical protein DOTSEDRAFT_72093 [Dothistroma septosporum NZE10]|uniref:Uncharacterized protein n=1 Tax=Dothistroma septosporum (strain NZE10 / CBS 128990) TaxID=675120 RepID=N1PLY0_DOTSN|nr:hypothetical protein DOTSEDRAFT_72093 [Dothistroma septosporum NZE10]
MPIESMAKFAFSHPMNSVLKYSNSDQCRRTSYRTNPQAVGAGHTVLCMMAHLKDIDLQHIRSLVLDRPEYATVPRWHSKWHRPIFGLLIRGSRNEPSLKMSRRETGYAGPQQRCLSSKHRSPTS